MAFSMVVPGGRAWLVHEAPRSELDKITPDGEPSGGVALPTSWQCVSEEHVRPLKYGMPRGAVLSVAIERCFQVDPALVVVMMLRRLPHWDHRWWLPFVLRRCRIGGSYR